MMSTKSAPVMPATKPASAMQATRPAPAQPATCSELAVVARLDHYTIAVDPRCCLCFARRTAVPFERSADIEDCFARIEELLAELPRTRYMLLVDARGGPGRNDPAFEAVMSRSRGKLLFGFLRNAALAVSAAGRLQIQRYAKIDGRVVFATDSPADAFAYLGVPQHSV